MAVIHVLSVVSPLPILYEYLILFISHRFLCVHVAIIVAPCRVVVET